MCSERIVGAAIDTHRGWSGPKSITIVQAEGPQGWPTGSSSREAYAHGKEKMPLALPPHGVVRDLEAGHAIFLPSKSTLESGGYP